MPTGNAGSPLAALQPSLLEFPFDTTRAVANLVVESREVPHEVIVEEIVEALARYPLPAGDGGAPAS